ncbi:MAG: 3-isopropylmalate dehydrogenase [Deltaproteobacteria bacterium]|nr:3-isopropylmalate dehydrogenase [Deltaproteobacteria bacterium]
MTKRIVIMDGDGIGPEVNRQATMVLKAAAAQAGLELELEEAPIGGAGYDAAGHPLPEDSLKRAKASDAVLLGAIGGPQYDKLDFSLRPERGILQLRAGLELFANLRPASIYGDLAEASTLKSEVVKNTDLMVVRELTGGIYFGQPRGIEGEKGRRKGFNTMVYTEPEIERIGRIGFEIAGKRRRQLLSVDKANVLEVSVLWREVMESLAPEYPDVKLEHMYVDNASMQLIRNPQGLDTICTGNMFGDILSDAAAMLTGSIGMLPSASIGSRYAMYEPVHGSAPDIAGQDKANPLAAILSVGMMFRYSFDMPQVEDAIRQAVVSTLATWRTSDIMTPGKKQVGCMEMGERVVENLKV